MRQIRSSLVRYRDSAGNVHVGVDEGEAVRRLPVGGICELLRLRVDELRVLVAAPGPAETDVQLLAPADGLMEVWAAGVTYLRSRDARVEETTQRSVYDLVYEAERPELFFKAPAWRVVTDNEPIAVREDSAVNVPEPELGVVVNAHGEIAGYVVVNDVSSRAIEGENPLYLPQAKVYAGSCAVSAGIVPAWLVEPDALEIEMRVLRRGETVFEGRTSTTEFHRPVTGLVPYLTEWLDFPDGVILSTGTGIVPEMDFDLRPGDTVDIRVADVGRLVNTVLTTREWIGARGVLPVT